MRITFLGTTHGVPEPGRKYSCTLVEAGGRKYLIDAGTDPMPELIDRGIHPCEISAIFITHRHGDHTGGLVPFINLCSWHYKQQVDPEIFLPDMCLVNGINAWISAIHDQARMDFRYRLIKEGLIYDDGVLRVIAMKTGHMENSYAFKLEAEGKTVLFTGDMKTVDGPVADYGRFSENSHYDAVIAECAHFEAMLYLDPLRKNPPKRFYINHYSLKYVEGCHHLRKELVNEIPVTLVTDGYEIQL